MCNYFNTSPQQHYSVIHFTFSFDVGISLAGGHFLPATKLGEQTDFSFNNNETWGDYIDNKSMCL